VVTNQFNQYHHAARLNAWIIYENADTRLGSAADKEIHSERFGLGRNRAREKNPRHSGWRRAAFPHTHTHASPPGKVWKADRAKFAKQRPLYANFTFPASWIICLQKVCRGIKVPAARYKWALGSAQAANLLRYSSGRVVRRTDQQSHKV